MVVPASINRYLPYYQRIGIEFLFNCIARKKGVILGGDMGLGKTIQVISILAALQRKTGTTDDLKEIQKQQKRALKKKIKRRDTMVYSNDGKGDVSSHLFNKHLSHCSPVLIIVPPSLIENCSKEFIIWSYFSVSVFQDKDRIVAFERIKDGFDDFLICSRSVLIQKESFLLVREIRWNLIIIDEFH